jgi:Ca2+-binding EF-hand superfamily protein
MQFRAIINNLSNVCLFVQDGTISKNDLRAAFDNVGKLMTDSELDDMLGEVGGSCSFDNMIKMFQTKMAGGI